TKQNTDTFRKQLKSFGFSFDWSREINTTDPKYYKWTQWIFLQLYKHGLAYKKKMPINWCPSCKIGLANEEVIGGACERCGTQTTEKEKEQWLLRITKYADRLLEDLKKVDYSERIKVQQANWIGKSEGAEIEFRIQNLEFRIKAFTTRPDTLFGATYLVLAPEHELIANCKLLIANWKEVENYIKKAKNKSEEERLTEVKEKTGIEIKGIKAINPVNKKEIPIFVADYVLGSYGTGAIMAVPAHDQRDFDFAKKFKLPVIKVINPVLMSVANPAAKANAAISELAIAGLWEGEGEMMNSGKFNGMNSEKAKWEIMKFAGGKKETQYHLRDWIFSRQHYWGEPIPIVFCDKCGEAPVPEKDLPVKLPEVKNYKPTDTGESPLAAIKNWVNVKCPKCGGSAKRETDTMPNWAGSSWYYLAYAMFGNRKSKIKNQKYVWDKKRLKYWTPVDWYNGGMEHTTLHLLYSRFWNKFLFDIGAAPVSEPYKKRTSHGMILGKGGEKMSKSRGNVVEPDSLIKQFGADNIRLYEMFMGPFDQAITWDHNGIAGTTRFISRVLGINENRNFKRGAKNPKLARLISQTVKKVGEDIEKMNFNTAVASLMIFVNEANGEKEIPLEIWEKFLKITAPFAPHISEELWHLLGHKKSIHLEKWPKYDPELIKEENFELIVQINGKVRDKISVSTGISQKEAENIAFTSEKVKMWLKEGKIRKVIFVPNKLINVVVN
ncbi:leucine--tRNA ligase, partial [Candidatus Wolfebacteria bacterium]|nr:leucine--tRNA ligase [Candidatus Wolfebacteria bacterium]